MDPIAGLLTSIRNASRKGLEKTDVPFSKIKMNLSKVLKEEGYIQSYRLMEENKMPFIRVQLKYTDEKLPVIRGIKRISRPGLRFYQKSKLMGRTSKEMGICVVSTSKGLMADKKARQMKLGGEVLCQVW
jgi:small subunit ribosomal protein S8